MPAAAADLAEAAAVAIARPGHENATYELTGPRAIDWTDLAALAASIDGRSIRYRPVDPRRVPPVPSRPRTIASGDGSVYLTIEAQSAGQGADRDRSEYGLV